MLLFYESDACLPYVSRHFRPVRGAFPPSRNEFEVTKEEDKEKVVKTATRSFFFPSVISLASFRTGLKIVNLS